ncbi:hypothetical protein AB0H57_25020 [Micromonospora sp. NPDC050686]|uniref:hypothetical protein n=1 Tax=Micromonospora sp. NPDC050686 TaxID=3154631 RepID=UPI0033E1DBA3
MPRGREHRETEVRVAERDRAGELRPLRAGGRRGGPGTAGTGNAHGVHRLAPTGRGRRRVDVLVGIAVLACLIALVNYLGAVRDREADPSDAGAPPGGGLPGAAFPAPPTFGASAGPASPGLRPRQQHPSTRPPAPSPPARPSRPPAPSPAPPPAPAVAVSQADVPAVVDLTAVGGADWVHWGLGGGAAPVRKRGGSGEIADEGGPGARGGYDTNPEGYGWRDGDPVERIDATMTGVYVCDVGNGFRLSVAGDGTTRTAVLYAGVWMARGRLDVRLSGGGPTTTLRLEDPHTTHTAQFTIRFQAARGAKVLISWTAEESFTGCGNVNLQALALR